ncbi:formyltransferase family protein [Crassaminicella indica]|uniref:Formyl transferase N-terminal domain-containing protein n=1 Tax=Crassaminicella indica TaxID=2855394 RepID=A0ABX8R9S7_9CLOT|nr:formyltransferase family protein [Crassaminicella indica]QXM05177.1 hypothetical protein KVH43_07165 [Crassaminicella indica]
MIITLLCDNPNSWIRPYIEELVEELTELNHEVYFIDRYKEIKNGHIAFFLGCEKIIPKKYLNLNKHNLVIHESALPKGKGWSPLTWQVLEGENQIPITLFEAVEKVDAGDIYLQDIIKLDGTELLTEIKHKQGIMTKKLVLEFIKKYPNITCKKQEGEESFYKRRTPKDSELDVNKTIKEQFNLLRVVDNERYPAFFFIDGQKYTIRIYKE